MSNVEQVTKPCRIFFKKGGRAKYISHLDLSKAMQRALKRSGLPVWYTQGFHPRIHLSFSLPISLGYESRWETMDVKLWCDPEAELPREEILARLGAALPEGLEVVDAATPQMKPEKIAFGEYEITLYLKDITGEEGAKAFADFCAQEEILTLKRSKKGEQEVDIRPLFGVSKIRGEGECLFVHLTCAAGSTVNLNPGLVVSTFCTFAQVEHLGLDVLRIGLTTANGEIFR